MKIIYPIFLLVFSGLFVFNTNGQEFSFKHYQMTEGLIGNYVYDAVQDKDGFMWFATETGVSRFDGTSFKNFTTADGLPDNEIIKLFADSKGRVWMAPFNNSICFYQNGRIHNAQNDSTVKKIEIKEIVLSIIEDNEGNLFFYEHLGFSVLTKNGIALNKFNSGSKLLFNYAGGVNNKSEVLFFETDFNDLNAVSTKMYRVSISGKQLNLNQVNLGIPFMGKKLSYTYVNNMYYVYNYKTKYDKDHALIFNNYLNGNIDTIKVPDHFNFLSFINDSILIFNSGHGAREFNINTKRYGNIYLQNENVSRTYRDIQNNLWFTTLGNGIFRLRSENVLNINYFENMSRRSIESITGNDSYVFAGTENSSVLRINKKSNKIDLFQLNTVNERKVIKILPYKGTIYIVAEDGVFKAENNFEKISEVKMSQLVLTYKDLDIDYSNEKFYYASHLRIGSLGINSNVMENLTEERITSVCSTDSGIYFGTISGLKFVSKNSNVITFGEKFPVLKSRITKIIRAQDNIWIGTNDQGVICFDGKKIITQITAAEKLSGNLVRAMYPDKKFLWVGTDRGLNKIGLSNSTYKVLQTYTVSNGLTSNLINAVFTQGDTVYVGTAEGLSVFDQRKINFKSICILKILAINVSGKNIADTPEPFLLGQRDNNIKIEFVAISFRSEGDIKYYYKLSGIDEDWKLTTSNFLEYPTLPSGKYTFSLYAINKFGVVSKMEKIEFEVAKKLTEKPWFIMLAIGFFISIVFLIAAWNIARIKRLSREKASNASKISSLEQQALKAQMNPHFIFNCLNSIQQYVIDKDVEGANKFISGFSKLIRQTLDNSGKETITVNEEIAFLRSYLELEKNRFEDKFDYLINISENIDKNETGLPPMLLQPFVENAIRHGLMHKRDGRGLITINFDGSQTHLICSVIDNGIGREAASVFNQRKNASHVSKGISVTGQRIFLLNMEKGANIQLKTEDLKNADHVPCGTAITIYIPLEKTTH